MDGDFMTELNVASTNLEVENIAGELNLLLLNVPDDVPLIEQIRWLYIKAGELFSYDYRIGSDITVALKEIDFEKNYISRYQTCTQISYLLKLMLEYLDPNMQVNIIRRIGAIRPRDGVDHVANEVILPTGEKYILDLTLDLYLIQSGCKTKQFGYTSDMSGDHDILTLRECEEMDRKLGLIKNGEYTDDKLMRLKRELEQNQNYDNPEDEINAKINTIGNQMIKFTGAYEAKLYLDKLFVEFLETPYREFSITYQHGSTNQLVTAFVIYPKGSEEKWIMFNPRIGILKTSKEKIMKMLENGWSTNSNTLNEIYRDYVGMKM